MNDRFRRATAVRLVDQSDSGARFDADVVDGWDIGGNANGGYLLAIAGRAMAETVDRPPLTITAHYLRPAPAGPCTIEVDVVRSGRRLATASATLLQEGRAVLRLLGTFGSQRVGGPSLLAEEPIELPPFELCAQRPQTAESPALVHNLSCRIHPDDSGFAEGRPSGRTEIRGWFDLADGEAIDAIALLLAADAFPPPIFNSGLPAAWVPTVELTVHVRGVPAPGPLRCRFRSRFVRDGLVDEDGDIWDSAGILVAQSRQLSLTPRPD